MVLIKQEKGAVNNVGHYLRSVFLPLQNSKLTGTLISQNNWFHKEILSSCCNYPDVAWLDVLVWEKDWQSLDGILEEWSGNPTHRDNLLSSIGISVNILWGALFRMCREVDVMTLDPNVIRYYFSVSRQISLKRDSYNLNRISLHQVSTNKC